MRLSFAQAALIILGLAGMEAYVEQYMLATVLGLLAVALFGLHWYLKRRRKARRTYEDDARLFL
jgi:O-antigen/teichoic acid export membrane protein